MYYQFEKDGQNSKFEQITDPKKGQIYIKDLKYNQRLTVTKLKDTQNNRKWEKLSGLPRTFTIKEKNEVFDIPVVQIIEKPKPLKPLELPKAQAKPPQTEKRRQTTFNNPQGPPSTIKGNIIFKFTPPEAKPQKENIILKYIENGIEHSFSDNDFDIKLNILRLKLAKSFESISLNVVNGKKYELSKPFVLDTKKIEFYASPDNNAQVTINLSKKKKSSSH